VNKIQKQSFGDRGDRVFLDHSVVAKVSRIVMPAEIPFDEISVTRHPPPRSYRVAECSESWHSVMGWSGGGTGRVTDIFKIISAGVTDISLITPGWVRSDLEISGHHGHRNPSRVTELTDFLFELRLCKLVPRALTRMRIRAPVRSEYRKIPNSVTLLHKQTPRGATVSDRHDRYTLNKSLSKLQATLAKAERKLPLSQPVRSWHLYADAITAIDTLTTQIQARIDNAQVAAS
jgi:hypothetical protein